MHTFGLGVGVREGGRRGKEEKYGKASVAKGRELGKQVDMLKIT